MKYPLMQLLSSQSLPELAAAVRTRRESVLRRWREAVMPAIPHASGLNLAKLLEDVPRVMEHLVEALGETDSEPTRMLIEGAGTHGEMHFEQDFDLVSLIMEFNLLRPILAEEIARQMERDLAVEEVIALNLAIDFTLRRGIVSFVNQQKQEIQASVESQSKYLSFLSHDLRGGLNGILLIIEVLNRDLIHEPRFADSLRDLTMMRGAILETVSTMERFLHAERLRKGKIQVQLAPMNLNQAIADLTSQFAHRAEEKGLKLNVDVPREARIVSDHQLLNMILQNLIGNAIKYTDRGEVSIDARREASWRLRVRDQGPGIDPDKLANLFQPFTRGDTHGQTGSGLGLSIARQAAELLGAKLWAESKLGAGSVFYLDLPVHPQEAK